jgi:tRNA-dihydrouridine synthase C
VRAASRGEELDPLPWPAVLELLRHFFALTLASYDARHAGNPLKQWLVYLRGYYPQAALFFEQVKRLRDPAELAEALDRAADPRAAAA